MSHASVPTMHATAATRHSTKARAALGPIASNTSSFAEAPGCATPRGAERGASFGLATAESSPDGAVDRRSATEALCGAVPFFAGTSPPNAPFKFVSGLAASSTAAVIFAWAQADPAGEPSMRPQYEGRRAIQTRLVVTVQFRFRTAPFTVPPELEHVCEPDAAVVVQGDRGEDAGTVLCVERDPCAAVPHCAVTRLASPADLHRVRVASEFAVLVLERVCVLAKVEATRNPQFQQLVVVDVDVQMDLNKVYVHYTSPWRVQFGNFTRALWQALPFKPRIWMNQINFADTSRMSIKGRASRNNPAPPKNPSPPKGRAPRHERPSAGGPGPQRRQHDGEHPK